MDEEKQLQPALKHKAALLKRLLPLDIILVVITLLTSLFIILEAILSSHGIILNFSNYGHSMDPTIKGNALCAFDTTVPFVTSNRISHRNTLMRCSVMFYHILDIGHATKEGIFKVQE